MGRGRSGTPRGCRQRAPARRSGDRSAELGGGRDGGCGAAAAAAAARHGDGPGRGGQGLRGALLPDVRHQPRRAGGAVPGHLHAHLRGPEVPGPGRHRRQARLAPLPALRAPDRHRRLPAVGTPGRHARLRLRLYPHRPRGAPHQVLPGVPFAAGWR